MPGGRCSECPLAEEGFVPNYYPPRGPAEPILFVGQAPGEVETFTRVPFTGPAGKTQYGIMRKADMKKEEYPFANSVCCWPPGDRKPTQLEIDCCRDNLLDAIERADPTLIVALGEVAAMALTGRKVAPLTQRGMVLPLKSFFGREIPVLLCLHPSFVMRQRQWIPTAVEDMERARKMCRGTYVVKDSTSFDFDLDPNPSSLAEYLGKDKGIVVFDIETTSLNPRLGEILGISFSVNPESAVACKFTEGDTRREVVDKVLQDKRRPKAAQNGSFDIGFIYEQWKYMTPSLRFDTRLAQQLLNSDLPTNLDHLRSSYTSIAPYKPGAKAMANIAHWDTKEMLTYGCLDAVTTYQVMEAQKPLLGKDMIKLKEQLLLPLVYPLIEMESKGVYVNKNELAAAYAKMLPLKDRILEDFTEVGFNPGSPKQVAAYFNLPNTEEETMKEFIQKDHPGADLIQRVLDYRKVAKTLSTDLKGLFNRLEKDRVHTSYKLDGTGTGRLSSEDPNLQNVPANIRYLYEVDDPDYLFIEGDYSQLELRVGGLIAPEPLILKLLAEGGDPHEELRAEMYKGKPLEERQRLLAKSVVFGTLYERSAWSISRAFGVPVHTAEQWQQMCIKKYPGFVLYKKRCLKEFQSSGYLTTPWGRRRVITEERQGYNFPIQSSASDVTLSTLLEVYRANLDLRLTVHDSIVVHVNKKEIKEVLETLQEIFFRPIAAMKNYRFPAKFKVGPNWGDLVEVKNAKDVEGFLKTKKSREKTPGSSSKPRKKTNSKRTAPSRQKGVK